MKYLKRFNEELDPKTYRRAGYELSGKFKEKRAIEPFEGHILDIISALGADSEHYEKIMENLGKISINSLYDDAAESYMPKPRWFNGNRMT